MAKGEKKMDADPRAPTRHKDDALRRLLSFHGEIRAAVNQLAVLARGDEPEPKSAAHELLRFFAGPFAWHDLDEEASLLPRLRRLPNPPEDLTEMVDAVSADHDRLETFLDELVPLLEMVALGREKPDEERLVRASQELRGLILSHLALEERTVFPLAARLLSREELAGLFREIEDRAETREEGRSNALEID
jgi:hemerythrin-like domain-containing protein